MILVENIYKNFGSIEAVKGLSFQMKRGEVVGFLGPNGAGKTTTMRLLTGFLPPSKGSITVDGLDVVTHHQEVRRKIGYLPESNPLYLDMEVADYLLYMGSLRGLSPARLFEGLREVVELCGLKEVSDRKIGTLSKGFRQRVGLALALLHKPDVLVLDEPTVGLDPNQIIEIRQLIKNIGQDRTILLSSHILSEVEQTCQRVLIIAKGQIVAQGSPQELMSQSKGATLYSLGVRAPKELLEKTFREIPGFENLIFVSEKEGVYFVHLTLKSPFDQRENLFKLIVSKGWSLVELGRQEANLETVFKELTQEQQASF